MCMYLKHFTSAVYVDWRSAFTWYVWPACSLLPQPGLETGNRHSKPRHQHIPTRAHRSPIVIISHITFVWETSKFIDNKDVLISELRPLLHSSLGCRVGVRISLHVNTAHNYALGVGKEILKIIITIGTCYYNLYGYDQCPCTSNLNISAKLKIK